MEPGAQAGLGFADVMGWRLDAWRQARETGFTRSHPEILLERTCGEGLRRGPECRSWLAKDGVPGRIVVPVAGSLRSGRAGSARWAALRLRLELWRTKPEN